MTFGRLSKTIMEIKIPLPNPDDVSAEQFFAQMRISLKAAEKSYQLAVNNLTKEKDGKEPEKPWLRFRLRNDIEEKLEEMIPDSSNDIQEIYLGVNTL